jgi:hypothetical protein
MDVVYLCREGENEELRYSLRSLANLPHDRVWVYGGAPEWCTAEVVPIQPVINKWSHTQRSLHAACADPEVSDPFILFNDDFYVTQRVDEVLPMTIGTIAEVVARYEAAGYPSSGYVNAMRDTRTLLIERSIPEPVSFEGHVPMVMSKAGVLEALAVVAGMRRGHWRTVYGNLSRLDAARIADVKVSYVTDPVLAGPWLSTNDQTFPHVRPALHALFPRPCVYERPQPRRVYRIDERGRRVLERIALAVP